MTTIVETEATLLPGEAIPRESLRPAISWGAVAAGAVVSCAFTLFLLDVLAGLGLLSVSPWSNNNPSGTTLHVAGGIALVLIAVMSSAVGGYLAARLRTRWVNLHDDEVYFRDSAHGVVAWAFATLITAFVLAAGTSSVLGNLAHGAASNPGLVSDTNAYYVDQLFAAGGRTPPAAAADRETQNAEATRVFAHALGAGGTISSDDRTRLAQLVAARTGLSQQEAEQRVDSVINRAKEAADTARKAAAKIALWMAAALLAGGLSAGLGAIEGGRLRDD